MTKIERIILNLPVISFLVEKSKKIILPGFEGVPLYDVAVFFMSEIKKEGLTDRASGIAYNFIMAIPPTCLFLFTLIPNLPFIPKRNIRHQLNVLIRDVIPAKEYNAGLVNFVDSFLNESRIGLLSFGFILLLYFASNGMMGLMRAFNKNYVGFQKRTYFQTRWMAIKITIINMGLLVACLSLLVLQPTVIMWLGLKNFTLLFIITFFRWIFILSLIFYTFAFIYKYAPAVEKRWRLLSPGSILGATMSVLATLGFSIFVNNFGKYNALYGSIGTTIVIMLVIYINSLILIIGYELNASIHSLRALAKERARQEEAAAAAMSA